MRIKVLVAILAATSIVQAQNTTNTRLLSQPAVSASRVAFAYAGDALSGWQTRRLQCAGSGVSGMETLSRRTQLDHFALHHGIASGGEDPATRHAIQRRRRDVVGRHDLLPQRP